MTQTTNSLRLTNLSQRVGWITHALKATFTQPFADLALVFGPMISHDAVVFDIGAHGGHFTKLFSRLAPAGRVYAVEPSSYARSILRSMLRWNRLRNVTVLPVGVSDAPGWANLSTPIKRKGDLGFGLAHLGLDTSGRDILAHEVELTTIDAIAATVDLYRLDFIKMDIEGWELNAVRGGIETLKRFRPPIYMEVNHDHLARAGATPPALWEAMTSLGYSALSMPEQTPASGYVRSTDYLWLPKR